MLFGFLLCRLTSGAFTIDSSTPTLRINLNEHPIYLYPKDLLLFFLIMHNRKLQLMKHKAFVHILFFINLFFALPFDALDITEEA
jgi:hypothetical protein